MRLSDLADLGTGALRFGYTTPTSIMTEMDRVDAAATALNGSFVQNVGDPATRQAWFEWLTRWRAYYEAKTSWLWRSSAVAQAKSDEWRDEVNAWARDLEGWKSTYNAQKTAQGEPLPPVPGPGTPPPLTKPSDSPGRHGDGVDLLNPLGVPWWGWLIGILGVAGLGAYAFYRVASKEAELAERLLPAMTGRDPGGPASVVHIHTSSDRGVGSPSATSDSVGPSRPTL